MPGVGTKQKRVSEPTNHSATTPVATAAAAPTPVAPASLAIAAAATAVEDPRKTTDEVLSEFAQLCVALPATGALIAVRDLTGLRCNVSFGNAPAVGSRLPTNSALRRECLDTGEIAQCEDAEIDPRIPTRAARFLGFRTAAAVPILAQGSVVGLIEVFCFEPSAISPDAIADLQRIAKSFAALLIFDAAHGGEPVVGGSVDEPIVLPRLVAEPAPASITPEPVAPVPVPRVALVADQPRVSVAAPSTTKPAAAKIEKPRSANPNQRPAKQKAEKPKLKNRGPGTLDISQLVPISPAAPAKEAASLAKLPSDRPIPTRVWLIAATLLLALFLALFFLLRGATPTNDDPDASLRKTGPGLIVQQQIEAPDFQSGEASLLGPLEKPANEIGL
jgi:hypothetical protein